MFQSYFCKEILLNNQLFNMAKSEVIFLRLYEIGQVLPCKLDGSSWCSVLLSLVKSYRPM